MDTDKLGWIDSYLTKRNAILHKIQKYILNLEAEKSFYALLQPTGIIYGHPAKEITDDIAFLKDSTVKDRLRILMCEGLINAAHYSSKQLLSPEFDQQKIEDLQKIILKAGKYLSSSLNFENKGSLLQKPIPDNYLADHLITQLSEQETSWAKPWSKVLNNSLMYIEVILFHNWMLNEEDKSFDIRQKRNSVVLATLQVMAMAAQADEVIKKEEKKIFNHFVNSSNLDDDKQDEAYNFLDDSMMLDDIDLTVFDSWLLKKYLLELAILISYSDRVIDKKEHAFLQELSEHLELTSEELESSILSIEAFVLNNWTVVGYLDGCKEIGIVKKRIQEKILKIINTNKAKLQTEIEESKELMMLIKKSTKTDLNAEEKKKVKEQLLDILKTIPALAIFLLPLGSLALPLLLKVLPKKLLIPSSFLN